MTIKQVPAGMGLKKPIIGWKKTYRSERGELRQVLVMLQIMGQYNVNAFDGIDRTNKRRTSKALVLAQFYLNRSLGINYAYSYASRYIGDMCYKPSYSSHDHSFVYRTGEIVTPKGTFELSSEACAPGIHYFADIDDAINY